MHRAACGCASGLRGGAEVLGQGVSLCGGERRSSAGNGLWGRRGMHGAAAGVRRGCVGEWKCSGRARRCVGAGAGLRRGMGCEVGGFNALSPQRLARTRIIIIRPPCPRCEIAAMGTKDAPCEHPSPAKTSVPAPSAFALPRRCSHFCAGVHSSPTKPSAAPHSLRLPAE